jgi:hypothetical protein
MKGTAAGISIGFLIVAQPAFGIWERSESLEWKVNVSEIVAVAEVSTAEIELPDPSREYFQSQRIACALTVMLKGQHGPSFTFRQNYRRKQDEPATDDRPLRPKDKLLIFAVKHAVRPGREILFWVNLTRPDVMLAQHAAYNNDGKWLGDPASILKLVRERIAAQGKLANQKRRGLIVDFDAAFEKSEIHWELVRTADPIYKADLIKQLRHSHDESVKEAAIYNLVSYPGKETVDLIRPYLTDPTTEEPQSQTGTAGSDQSTHQTAALFPLRQAAYSALRLLGESPKKPEGFQPNATTRFSLVGFESRVYFPYGDWKRDEP